MPLIVAYPDGLVKSKTVEEAVSRAKVFAHKGRTVVVYELREVFRIEPTNIPNVIA